MSLMLPTPSPSILRASVRAFRHRLVVSVVAVGIACPFGHSAWAQGKTTATNAKPTISIGVVDDAKLAATRSDFPSLLARVLPEIAKRRNLRFVLRKSGFAWGTPASTSTLDITDEVIARLKQITPATGTVVLTGEQMTSARQALEALQNLRSLTEAGEFKYDDFNQKFLDAYQTVTAKLRLLPPSPLREAIDSTLMMYRDSRDVWKECDHAADIAHQLSETERADHMAKLNPMARLKFSFTKDEKLEENLKMAYSQLYDHWRRTAQQLERAEALLPKL